MKKQKVIIIGAGPAGLTAGLELLNKSNIYDVTIIEESNYVGGISRTVNYKNNKMDIGGHRFFSKDEKVVEFWNKIMKKQGKPSYDDKKLNRYKPLDSNGPDPELEDNVMLIRNRISRIYYLNKFFDYPIKIKFETFKNLGFKNTIVGGVSYLKSCILKKKEDCLENFYINRFGKKLYNIFFLKYTTKVWGKSPSDISADWGVQRAKGLSIIAVIKDKFQKKFGKKNNIETSLIEQFYYPKYGPGAFWEQVLEEFKNKGGKILKNHKVIKLYNKNNKIVSVDCTSKDKIINIKGDIFISSMPLKDLFISLDGEIPKEINNIAINLPYRDFITVGLLVKKIDLVNNTNIKTLNNIIPDCWIYVQDENIKLGRIQVFNNWSPYLVDDPDNTVWLGLEYFCNENDEFWNMSDKEFTNFAIEELIKMKIIKRNYVLDSHREKVKKAYPAYFGTYKDISKVIKYLNKFNNLYCIGRNGQHRYNNMDHSMITAFETVDNIINKRKNKDNIWNVNIEKSYHEEKLK